MNPLDLYVRWRTRMLFIISDASVLIDIECSGLTSAMFKLPYQFVVPDILFDEELAEKHSDLLQFGLISRTMSGELIEEAYNLRQKHSKPSVNDLLALILAKYENCQLLTGDKALRQVAVIFNIQVFGTIWLVEQMIQYQIINVDDARIAFQRMKSLGSRLPWDEVEKMLLKVERVNSVFEA